METAAAPAKTATPPQARQTKQAKTGVLMVNLGTPDSPNVPDVRRYLRQFLMDGRVIDVPFFARFLLVQGIIAPFRSFRSAREYKKLWTEDGSPLYYHGVAVEEMLQERLGEDYQVELAMRYQNPSIPSKLEKMRDAGLEKIVVLPMFPQYASATTGSIHDEVMRLLRKWQWMPKLSFIDAYPDHPGIVKIFAENAKKMIAEQEYDFYLFSFHGLPERQLRKGSDKWECMPKPPKPLKPGDFKSGLLGLDMENHDASQHQCKDGFKYASCCDDFNPLNRLCYRAQCLQTTKAIVAELGLKEGEYAMSFQSRLGSDEWIKPYTEDTIEDLGKAGKKRVLVFSPAFVADCLETTIEIGEEYVEVFEEHGGEVLHLVESLNQQPAWADTLKEIVLAH